VGKTDSPGVRSSFSSTAQRLRGHPAAVTDAGGQAPTRLSLVVHSARRSAWIESSAARTTPGLSRGIENVIRDRLAWALHSHLQGKADVVREWQRRDIALFLLDKPSKPAVVIELKSMALGQQRWRLLINDLENDQKALSDGPPTQIFGIQLVTITDTRLAERHRHLSKYASGRNWPHRSTTPSDRHQTGTSRSTA